MTKQVNEQGSRAWREDKAGVLSASRFKDILGSKRAREVYREDILRELEDGECTNLPNYRPLAHGKSNEDKARALYELENNTDIYVPGFIKHLKFPFIGASSDGLIIRTSPLTSRTGLEIKCPVDESRHNIVLAGMPDEHAPQVQGNIWVLNLDQLDFVSYMRGQPRELITTRIYRDDKYISKLEVACLEFWEYICTGVDPRFTNVKLF